MDADDFEDCEFSWKFRAETIRDMEKLMACVGHKNHSKVVQVETFENVISENNFKWSDGSEYILNMSDMIKIIILDGT